MSSKFLDYTGLTYLVGKIKALIPTKTSDLTNDSNFQENVIETIKMNGVTQTISNKEVNIKEIKTLTTLTDVDTLTDTGTYAIKFSHTVENSNLPVTNWGILYVYGTDVASDTGCFQMYVVDGNNSGIYKRKWTPATGVFGDWFLFNPPTSHASSSDTYGLGRTDVYGHCKTINGLTRTAYADGEALSAYQGNVLDGKKVNKAGDTMTGALTIKNGGLVIGTATTKIQNLAGSGGIACGKAQGNEGTIIAKAGSGANYAFGQANSYGNILAGKDSSSSSSTALAFGDVSGTSTNAQGYITSSGIGSVAMGRVSSAGTLEATNYASVAIGDVEGKTITCSGRGAIAGGYSSGTRNITASGNGSIGFGYTQDSGGILASGVGSFAGGRCSYGQTEASGISTFAFGDNAKATGYTATAFGIGVTASGRGSLAANEGTIANGRFMTALGRNNAEGTAISSATSTSGDVLIVGKGTASDARSNCMRLTIAGKLYLLQSYSSSGADYAETTEWLDGNPNEEDRIGHFVCMVGNKMRYATANDTRSRIGIVSSVPAVIGDNFSEEWHGKYKTDIYGRKLTRTVHYEEQVDEEGTVIQEECDAQEWILADDYDPTQTYVSREERPEYGYFGMLGKLVVIDDGTCQVDGYCYPNNNGIATAEPDANKGFYVMERLDETHIKVLLK